MAAACCAAAVLTAAEKSIDWPTDGVAWSRGANCRPAVSIFAQQKTGSTFLGRLSRDLALRYSMCKVYQNTKEFLCETTVSIDCPRRAGVANKSIWMERTFSREAAALARSGWAGPAASPKCSDAERHQMYVSATAWLRSSQRAEKRRKRRVASVGTVLGARGYVRGPLRQLCALTSSCAASASCDTGGIPTASATASTPTSTAPSASVSPCAWPASSTHRVLIVVHTRHPIEMMVSAYFCITDPKVRQCSCESAGQYTHGSAPRMKHASAASEGRAALDLRSYMLSPLHDSRVSDVGTVCPVRTKALGSNFVPRNDSVANVDVFVSRGLRTVGSTPSAVLARSERAAAFIRSFAPNAAVPRAHGICGLPVLLHSKYERMVSDFSGWSLELLRAISPVGSSVGDVHRSIVRRYSREFVPDGKHKHSLTVGSNLAQLGHATMHDIRSLHRVNRLLTDLGYMWSSPYTT